MQNLSQSIKRNGILQPLTVRELENDQYELIAGERRFRAAQMVGLKFVPAYVLSIETDVEMMEYALIENIQRVDLNPIEEAEAYAMLSGKYDLSHDEVIQNLTNSRTYFMTWEDECFPIAGLEALSCGVPLILNSTSCPI